VAGYLVLAERGAFFLFDWGRLSCDGGEDEREGEYTGHAIRCDAEGAAFPGGKGEALLPELNDRFLCQRKEG